MYIANKNRYAAMKYNRCGNSGLKLPAVSLGLWHNFGNEDNRANMQEMLRTAFDLGITHFDLANNYGPPPESAEENFGEIYLKDFVPYRDEIIVSTKAGYTSWDGPYGDFGSRKYLVSSLDRSLKNMRLDYVDIFYHHRPDPDTSLEETMTALDFIVRQGKALYAGISNYNPEQTVEAAKILRRLGTPAVINQVSYSMLNRWAEDGLLDTLERENMGCIVFSPLQKGLLTDKYLNGIPEDSRAASGSVFLNTSDVTPEIVGKVRQLNKIAESRGQKMAEMALSWVLKDKRVTSVLIGASRPSQITDCVKAIDNSVFLAEELDRIEEVLNT